MYVSEVQLMFLYWPGDGCAALWMLNENRLLKMPLAENLHEVTQGIIVSSGLLDVLKIVFPTDSPRKYKTLIFKIK